MEVISNIVSTFLTEYIWYHAFTITVIAVIAILIAVHRTGSEKNLSVAKQYQSVLDPLLNKTFDDYDGELVLESPNILKLYASGR